MLNSLKEKTAGFVVACIVCVLLVFVVYSVVDYVMTSEDTLEAVSAYMSSGKSAPANYRSAFGTPKYVYNTETGQMESTMSFTNNPSTAVGFFGNGYSSMSQSQTFENGTVNLNMEGEYLWSPNTQEEITAMKSIMTDYGDSTARADAVFDSLVELLGHTEAYPNLAKYDAFDLACAITGNTMNEGRTLQWEESSANGTKHTGDNAPIVKKEMCAADGLKHLFVYDDTNGIYRDIGTFLRDSQHACYITNAGQLKNLYDLPSNHAWYTTANGIGIIQWSYARTRKYVEMAWQAWQDGKFSFESPESCWAMECLYIAYELNSNSRYYSFPLDAYKANTGKQDIDYTDISYLHLSAFITSKYECPGASLAYSYSKGFTKYYTAPGSSAVSFSSSSDFYNGKISHISLKQNKFYRSSDADAKMFSEAARLPSTRSVHTTYKDAYNHSCGYD